MFFNQFLFIFFFFISKYCNLIATGNYQKKKKINLIQLK